MIAGKDEHKSNEFSNISKQFIPQLTSIIILTYNKLMYTKQCIDSIRQYTAKDSYELIVVDNNSSDQTVAWLKQQPDIRVVANAENAGFPLGCNQGIALSRGDAILLLNNDTVVTTNWLSNLRAALFSANDIGAVSAVTNSCSNFQAVYCDYNSLDEMQRFANHVNHSRPERWEERKRLVGYCLLIKTAVVNKIGLLDELFTPGNYEDDDYCYRIRQAGYRLVLCRDVYIHHFGSVSFGEPAVGFNNLLGVNREKFTAKWKVNPQAAAPYERTSDPVAKAWLPYQYELGFNLQAMEFYGWKFEQLMAQAEYLMLTGELDRAALLIQQAAVSAYRTHPGFFCSAQLEQIIQDSAKNLDRRVPPLPVTVSARQAGKRHVLHVISQGYSSGGHTRLIKRWIDGDPTSVHSVVVTLNHTTNPAWLEAAAVQSGGWYKTLHSANVSLCQRAQLLRSLATAWADVVVLHIHPYDPVAPLAFGVPGSVPVIFLNHADHVFTIGMSVADLVVELRSAGQELSRSRRVSQRSCVLPLPLELPKPLLERRAAKQLLGVNPDSILILTIASAAKLVPCGEYNFSQLALAIINRLDNVNIVVIGPADTGDWAQLRQDSQGRIRAMGVHTDLHLFHSAADICLGSMPMGSLTAVLEAGAAGMPVIGRKVNIDTLNVDIMPEAVKTIYDNEQELLVALTRLCEDAEFRQAQGRALQTAIINKHYHNWLEALSTVYSSLPDAHQPAENVQPASGATVHDTCWFYFQRRSGI